MAHAQILCFTVELLAAVILMSLDATVIGFLIVVTIYSYYA